MTFENGRLQTNDAEEILEALMADAKEYFGPDLNDDDLAAIRLFYRPIAQRLAAAQQDLLMVLNSAQLDYAEGQSLDLLTALIGVTRSPATAASGRVIFSRDTRTHTTYTIQEGTEIQTDSSEPVSFETTASRTLPLFDSFERDSLGTDYDGDTGSVSIQSDTVLDGNRSLELDATDDARVYDDSLTTEQGMTIHYYTQCAPNTVPIFQFGKEDETSYYEIVIDQENGRVAVEVTENGMEPEVVAEDTSVDVPADERLDVELDWSLSGDITVAVVDGSGNEITSVYGRDTTHTQGYLGFKSGDANGQKWFDYVTTSETPAPVECTETGPVGNVGRNVLTIMPDPPTGIEEVTNTNSTNGGSEQEGDEELRERAKNELSQGSRASASALISKVLSIEGVTSVSLFTINTDDDGNSDGFELVIEGGSEEDIAQVILDTMAAGDTSHAGINGEAASASADLPNGQSMTIEFSRPEQVKVYVEADLVVDGTFEGEDAVRDSIVDYIGGQYSSGNDSNGLGSGDDVVHGEIEFAIREVRGVYDVENLYVNTVEGGTNQQNISIDNYQVATADGTDGSIEFTVSEQ